MTFDLRVSFIQLFHLLRMISQVDDFSDLFAFKPEGNYILTFRNEDRPGAISEVPLF